MKGFLIMYEEQYYDELVYSHSKSHGHHIKLIKDQKSVTLITLNLKSTVRTRDSIKIDLKIDGHEPYICTKSFQSQAEMMAEMSRQTDLIQSTMDMNFKL